MRLRRGAHATPLRLGARVPFPAPSPESSWQAEAKFISTVLGGGAEHRTRGRVRSPVRADSLVLQFQARELLRSLGAGKLAREIRAEWNPRMKSAAGRADFREKLIWLNPLLLELSAQLDRTKTDADKLDCLKQSSLTSAGYVVSWQTE